MISLSNFVDKQTVAFIAEPNPEMLDVLININRDLAGGLMTNPGEGDRLRADSPATPESRPSGVHEGTPSSVKISV